MSDDLKFSKNGVIYSSSYYQYFDYCSIFYAHNRPGNFTYKESYCTFSKAYLGFEYAEYLRLFKKLANVVMYM